MDEMCGESPGCPFLSRTLRNRNLDGFVALLATESNNLASVIVSESPAYES